MFRRLCLFLLTALLVTACSDPGAPIPSAVARSSIAAVPARERLARALALALADSSTRAAVKRRLDVSNAREGKLQFQALARTDGGMLLAALVRSSATSADELLADLDAAHGLELYLPVAAQRAAWLGDANYLVGTVGRDGDAPIAFDADGNRRVLDPDRPPAIPVLALVPQETDFTRGHPAMLMACVDMCGDDGAVTGGGGGYGSVNPGSAPGLYLVQSHFEHSYEGWLKGDPEFEFHVYGIDDSGQSVELACTSAAALGAYYWESPTVDWYGSVMLLSDADYNLYHARHPQAPIRIVAWEDDDEPCVDHADVTGIAALISAVDNAYKSVTSGKIDPWYVRGIKAAPSIFSLVTAIHNVILTNDDFIGNAVEGSITGDAPNGSNWVLKSNGTITTGWFTTARVP